MDGKESGLDLSFDGAGLKQVMTVLGIALALVLAVVVGSRLSPDALAIVVGIVCGLLASLPATLLLLFVLRRDGQAEDEGRPQQEDARRYPPVVIVQGGAPQALPPGIPSGYWPAATPPLRREFQIVDARNNLLSDDDSWQ